MAIEAEFLKNVASVNLPLRGIDYLLDFQKLSRRNVASGSERKLQRVPFEQLSEICGPPGPPPAQMPPPGPYWLFMDEKGEYMRISPEDSASVETVYKNAQGKGKVTLRGVEYELDFSCWKRKNVGSGSERSIRRVDPTSLPPVQPGDPGVMWCLKDDANCWMPYAPEDNQAIEAAFNANPTAASEVALLGGKVKYMMSFGEMKTQNIESKSERKIARILDGKVTNQ